MSCKCKTSIVLTVFEDAEVVAKGAKTLVVSANFPMHLRVKFCPSSCGGCHKGIIKIEQSYRCAHN
jgi:hypothetical protein